MKKIIVLLALAIALSGLGGCGLVDRIDATWTGEATKCIGGVEYLQFRNGATVAYNADGTIKTCGGK